MTWHWNDPWADACQELASAAELEAAWNRVRRGSAAAGPDGLTPVEAAHDWPDLLRGLQDDLGSGRYIPLPFKQLEVPKATSGLRVIQIPSVRDRVVQQALAAVQRSRRRFLDRGRTVPWPGMRGS